MNAKTFNENYEIDRQSKGVKAKPKHAAPPDARETPTADGTLYDASRTYYFFDEASREVRSSIGFRRIDEHLCAFGLKVVAVARLHASRDDALADGQKFFNAEIENLREKIRNYEAEKTPARRSLKAVLMSR